MESLALNNRSSPEDANSVISYILKRLTLKIIVLSTLTSLIAVITLSWLGIHTASTGIKTHTRLHLLSVAELKGDALTTWADTELAQSGDFVIDSISSNSSGARLSQHQRGIAVIDPVTASVEKMWLGMDPSHLELDEIVRHTAVGRHVSISTLNGEPSIVTIAEFNEEVGGIVVVLNESTALSRTLAPDSGLGATGEIRVSDERTGATWVISSESARFSAIESAQMTAFNDIQTIDGEDGEEILAARRSVIDDEISVTAAISKAEAFADLTELRRWIIWGATGALSISALVAIALGRGITLPLTRLMRRIEQVRFGSEVEPVPVTTQDEVGTLTEMFNRLTAELYDASQDLVTANDDLKHANETKNMFLSTVTHELKTPLTSILAFSDLLLRPNSELTDRQRQHLEAVRRNGRQLQMLIEDLLDISRIQAGTLRLEPVDSQVSDIVDTVLATMEPIFRGRDQRINVDIQAPDAVVNCDEGRIIQVLTNLLSNASKYSPENSEIALGMSAEGNHVRIAVRDNGIGISPENIERLFTPFFRVDNVQTRAVAGTGLGLVIAKRLAELHGGAISITSEVAKGSEFVVTLPLVNASEVAA